MTLLEDFVQGLVFKVAGLSWQSLKNLAFIKIWLS